jgi:hypothetical protein
MIIYNIDPTEMLHTVSEVQVLDNINSFIDPLADTQVKRFCCCPASSVAFANLEHWEIFADGFVPSLGVDQPALCGKPSRFRLAANLHHLRQQGIDQTEYSLRRARGNGLSPYVSVRMNDIHDGENPHSALHCRLWKEHPEWRISTIPYENGLNYNLLPVRELFLRRIFEIIERYDADGYECDWTRFPMFFPRGSEHPELITDMIRKIRQKTNWKTTVSGRKRHLSVRVPGTPDACRRIGLDVQRWIAENLIDDLTVAPFLTLDAELPMDQWRILAGSDIKIFYGLEIKYSSFPGGERRHVEREDIRGAASAAWQSGADGIYLFNFFKSTIANYPEMFTEIGSPETLRGKEARFHKTWHDVDLTLAESDSYMRFPETAARLQNRFELPRPVSPGTPARIKLHLGSIPQQPSEYILDIECAIPLEVNVNGNESPESPSNRFKIPSKWLLSGCNQLQISSKEDGIVTRISMSGNA